jgi:hypothetical protein
MPRPLGWGSFVPKNIEIAVVCANPIKGVVGAVPLVQHLLNQVFVPVQSKPDRSFVRLPTGIAIHLQFHAFLITPAQYQATPTAYPIDFCRSVTTLHVQ